MNMTIDKRAGLTRAVVGSVIFFIVAPMTVVGWIPYAISGWRLDPPLLGFTAIRAGGAILVLFAVAGLVDSFARFAVQGRGTPAPVAPTEHLVVSGLYRYARNPMYISVVSGIIGQGLLLGNLNVLRYAVIVWALVHTFVIVYEEPVLRTQFGRSYEAYRAHVPRWLPRLRPWVPQA